MFAAAALSALVLAGGTGSLWISNEKPREGTRYRAMTLWGNGELDCVAAIGRQAVPASVYRSRTHDVCVLLIPKGSAGKWLTIAWSTTERSEFVESTDEKGAPIRTGQITHADGIPIRRFIRR